MNLAGKDWIGPVTMHLNDIELSVLSIEIENHNQL